MLNLKCVYCPARGPNSDSCFKSIAHNVADRNKGKASLGETCVEAFLKCDFDYSDKSAVSNESLSKEGANAK